MKLNNLSSCAKCLIGLLVLGPSVGFGADVLLQKAPPLTIRQAPEFPENLARFHFGASVIATPENGPAAQLQLSSNGVDQNTSIAALLCDDPTTGYQLPAGKSTVLVSLPNIENVTSVSFLNEGAQGDYSVSISNANVPENSPEWHTLQKSDLASGALANKVGPGEAKYVKLVFNVTQPGRIAAFGVFATPALSDFTMPRPRKVSFEDNSPTVALINSSFTDVHAKARGLYVSSGDASQVNAMLDDQPTTSYHFAVNDATPTAVIDLGRERELSRLSAIYASQPGNFEFYVLRNLPTSSPSSEVSSVQQINNVGQSAELPPTFKMTEQSFAGLKPVGSVASNGEGRAAINFPEIAGRYVMIKWHPASPSKDGFSIAQVAAFGPAKPASQTVGRDAKDLDGKSILDNKDIPAEGPGEAQAPEEGPPPALPPVPPFTFIPEVPPTSP